MSLGRMYHLSWILSGVGFLGFTALGGALGSIPIFLFGLVYPMSFFAHAALVAIGTWIAAAGITFAFASRPQLLHVR